MSLGDVAITVENSVVIARLTGEIDLSNAQGIEDAVAAGTPNQALSVFLDMSALEYLDSAGIQLIYQLKEKLGIRGQSLKLVVPSDSPAADALKLAGVMDHLDTIESLQAARG